MSAQLLIVAILHRQTCPFLAEHSPRPGVTSNAGSVLIEGNTFTTGFFTNSGNLTINGGATLPTGSFTQSAGSTLLDNGAIDPPTTITVTGGTFGGTCSVDGKLSMSNATLLVVSGGLNITNDDTRSMGAIEFTGGAAGMPILTITSGHSYSVTGATFLFDFASGSTLPSEFNFASFIAGSGGTFNGGTFEYHIGSAPVSHSSGSRFNSMSFLPQIGCK